MLICYYARGFPSDLSLAWITILWTSPTDIMLTSKLLRPLTQRVVADR